MLRLMVGLVALVGGFILVAMLVAPSQPPCGHGILRMPVRRSTNSARTSALPFTAERRKRLKVRSR